MTKRIDNPTVEELQERINAALAWIAIHERSYGGSLQVAIGILRGNPYLVRHEECYLTVEELDALDEGDREAVELCASQLADRVERQCALEGWGTSGWFMVGEMLLATLLQRLEFENGEEDERP